MLVGVQPPLFNMVSSEASFTFREYEELLVETLSRFKVGGYDLLKKIDSLGVPLAIFRHDIDMSPEAALQIAKIEAKHNVKTSYTVLLGGAHYNPFEKATNRLLNEIVELGHDVGLHFPCQDYEMNSESEFVAKLAQEAKQLSYILSGKRVNFFSYHDPTQFALSLDSPYYAAMLNAYSGLIRNAFEYSSDSNGFWRHRDWKSLLAEYPKNIHLLTHPEWWSENKASPAEKVFSRFEKIMRLKWREYCVNLAGAGRPNHTVVPLYIQAIFPDLEDYAHELHRIWLQQKYVFCEAKLLQLLKENQAILSALDHKAYGKIVLGDEGVAAEKRKIIAEIKDVLIGVLGNEIHK
jgi:hypothetical protein